MKNFEVPDMKLSVLSNINIVTGSNELAMITRDLDVQDISNYSNDSE